MRSAAEFSNRASKAAVVFLLGGDHQDKLANNHPKIGDVPKRIVSHKRPLRSILVFTPPPFSEKTCNSHMFLHLLEVKFPSSLFWEPSLILGSILHLQILLLSPLRPLVGVIFAFLLPTGAVDTINSTCFSFILKVLVSFHESLKRT